MPIAKGEPWGQPGLLPPDGIVVGTDAEARAVVTDTRRAGRDLPVLGLVGGDLCRTLGGRGGERRLREGPATLVTVDVGSVLVDGRLHWFVAHLVARRRWWAGRVVVAMNAQYVGHWDVAPRGHPNDGRLEVLDGMLPLGQRLQARKRLLTGTHVPHPAIEQHRVAAHQIELERPTPVYLDGEAVGTARNLSIRIEADALTCVV